MPTCSGKNHISIPLHSDCKISSGSFIVWKTMDRFLKLLLKRQLLNASNFETSSQSRCVFKMAESSSLSWSFYYRIFTQVVHTWTLDLFCLKRDASLDLMPHLQASLNTCLSNITLLRALILVPARGVDEWENLHSPASEARSLSYLLEILWLAEDLKEERKVIRTFQVKSELWNSINQYLS